MKTNENGRSMVEMLGVLAIIGVLSVGGIYGYTSAMKKYKANEIIQTAGMMATVAHSKDAGQGGAVTSLSDAGLQNPISSITGLAMQASQPDENGIVTVTISGIGTDLCTIVKSVAPTDASKKPASGFVVSCTS